MNILVSFCLCTCVISICLVIKSLGYNGWRSLILFHIPNNFLMMLKQFTLCQNYIIFINTFNFTQWHACDGVSHCVFKWHFSEKMWSLALSVCILAIWSLSGYFFFFFGIFASFVPRQLVCVRSYVSRNSFLWMVPV